MYRYHVLEPLRFYLLMTPSKEQCNLVGLLLSHHPLPLEAWKCLLLGTLGSTLDSSVWGDSSVEIRLCLIGNRLNVVTDKKQVHSPR